MNFATPEKMISESDLSRQAFSGTCLSVVASASGWITRRLSVLSMAQGFAHLRVTFWLSRMWAVAISQSACAITPGNKWA
jgi:hypothetical protein